MCDDIFIGSDGVLPIVPWDDKNHSFYVSKAKESDIPKFVLDVMQSNYYYFVGSYMGCSCGLMYYEDDGDTDLEEKKKRRSDIKQFLAYLATHSQKNSLKFVSVTWDNFPDNIKLETFNLLAMDEKKLKALCYYFDENIIYQVCNSPNR